MPLCVCNCLLIRNSSNIFPLVLLSMSCHEVDMELLSIATVTSAPFACAIFAYIFSMPMSVGRLISRYMLAITILVLSIVPSKITTSSLESWFINIVYLIVVNNYNRPIYFS